MLEAQMEKEEERWGEEKEIVSVVSSVLYLTSSHWLSA